MDDFTLVDAPQKLSKAPETEFYLATVAGVSSSGARLLFAGESNATSKYYKCLDSANVSTGDRVVVMKQSGTYIVLGGISGSSEETTVITSLAQIATAKSGFRLVRGKYAQWGKLAMLYLQFTPTTAITTAQEFAIATMVEGKRPALNAPVNYWTNNGGEITADGTVYAYGVCSNTSATYTVFSTYLLA